MSPRSRTRKPRRSRRPTTRTAPERSDPTNTGRFTLPPQPRYRPTWHKLLGWALIALGIALVLANYSEYGDVGILPGGHQEGYFLLGFLTAALGTWWLGIYDRPQ